MSEIECLYCILSNKSKGWYSYSLDYLTKKTGISKRRLLYLAESDYFVKNYDDTLNVFKYEGVTYMGLQSRKIDYDHDKKLCVNKVEKLISEGYYASA